LGHNFLVEAAAHGRNDLKVCLTRDGRYLYVANANDNNVSVIDVPNRKVLETLNAALYPNAPTGSTTNGVSLSGDEKTLYIANADNNCLAVFDVQTPGSASSKGFIPVGWYPTNVKTLGNKILVANGKGFTSMANPKGPQPVKKTDNSGYQKGIVNSREQYIGGLFKGTLSFINAPNEAQLRAYTKQVYANTPFNNKIAATAPGEAGNPIPMKRGEKSPIKHVFYIIKENRTYDQVFGDMKDAAGRPVGNGDPALTIYGERVTPNHHQLARDYVLLDNLYCNSEVSVDGHSWCDAAMATDFNQRSWIISYSKHGKLPGNAEMETPSAGYLWDLCKRNGVTFKTYGETYVGDEPFLAQ